MAHTPGPWLIESKVYVCGGECCVAVTETYSAMQKLSPEQQEANARLIAAAPELLVALQVLLNANEHYFRDFKHLHLDITNPIDAAREAIAKATGKS